jgi:MOSC domain-containing protein YiiM
MKDENPSRRETGASRVYQISVSRGGVPKTPMPQAQFTSVGVDGDRQSNPRIHGGRDRAVCLFSFEVIEALQAEGHPIVPGSCGENLTLTGLDWARMKPGILLRVGNAVLLEITSYTSPCEVISESFLNGDYKRISHKRYPGWSRVYAKVLVEGLVRSGDPVALESKAAMPAAPVEKHG